MPSLYDEADVLSAFRWLCLGALVLAFTASACLLDRDGRLGAGEGVGGDGAETAGGGSTHDGGNAGGADAGGAVATGGASAGGAPPGSGGGVSVGGQGGSGGSVLDCSDGAIDAGEECDDGNLVSGDGCAADCTVECSGAMAAKHPVTFHCYQYDNGTLMTWDTARSLCQGLGAGWDLAVVTSAEERDFLDDTLALPEGAQFLNDDPFQYWLGGRDFTTSDEFEWFNGETWSYAPWDSNPQDPSHGNQDCIRLRAIAGTSNDVFRDAACGLTSSALCELQPAGT